MCEDCDSDSKLKNYETTYKKRLENIIIKIVTKDIENKEEGFIHITLNLYELLCNHPELKDVKLFNENGIYNTIDFVIFNCLNTKSEEEIRKEIKEKEDKLVSNYIG